MFGTSRRHVEYIQYMLINAKARRRGWDSGTAYELVCNLGAVFCERRGEIREDILENKLNENESLSMRMSVRKKRPSRHHCCDPFPICKGGIEEGPADEPSFNIASLPLTTANFRGPARRCKWFC